VDDNEFLVIEPPLSDAEVAAFRKASLDVRDTFLRLGGPGAGELLDRILVLSKQAHEEVPGQAPSRE
jgi:hypothetical protein